MNQLPRDQQFSHFDMAQHQLQGLLSIRVSFPGNLGQYSRFAFLRSFQMIRMLLVLETHFENHCTRMCPSNKQPENISGLEKQSFTYCSEFTLAMHQLTFSGTVLCVFYIPGSRLQNFHSTRKAQKQNYVIPIQRLLKNGIFHFYFHLMDKNKSYCQAIGQWKQKKRKRVTG